MDNLVCDLVEWLNEQEEGLRAKSENYVYAPRPEFQRGYHHAILSFISWIESRDDYRPAMRLTDNGKAACTEESE